MSRPMAESEEDRRRSDELIAALRALHEEQQILVREIRLLHQEIRALREEVGTRALQPEAPAAPAPSPVTVPGPPAAPPRRPQRTWRESLSGVVTRLPKPVIEAPRSLLERIWLLSLVVGLLAAGASELNLLQPVEVLAEYPKGWVRPEWSRREIVNQIVVVAIDEESIAKLGPWGARWRTYHGRLLTNLADDGARAVGLDVYFKTPSEEHDGAFVEGIQYAKSKGMGVVVAVEYDDRRNRFSTTVPSVREVVAEEASPYLPKDRVANLVRYFPMFQQDGVADEQVTRLIPAFSLAVAMAGGKRVEEFPRYRGGTVPIDFVGPSASFRAVSYAEVHDKTYPPGTFKGTYVVVGMFLNASKDFFDTPVETQMPGVVIHANALYTLLRGVGRPLEFPWRAVVVVAMAAVAGGICARFRRFPRALLVVTLVLGHWAVAITLGLTRNPLNLEVVPATVAAGLVWVGVAVREKVLTMRELRQTLGLPEDALRRLEQDRAFQQGTLGKRVTVLASDVRNYSVFSHSHPPAYVRAIMTEYQQMVERVIYRHGGYVNKFIGDAVLAIFGYPMPEETTAVRGVLAAKEIHDGLRALIEKWNREQKEGIAGIRTGMNTGLVSVSYLGSAKKQLDVMGDNVDLAARLESAAGEFDCIALLGPATYEEVKTRIRSRTVPVRLKNRPDVTEAFTLDGLVP